MHVSTLYESIAAMRISRLCDSRGRKINFCRCSPNARIRERAKGGKKVVKKDQEEEEEEEEEQEQEQEQEQEGEGRHREGQVKVRGYLSSSLPWSETVLFLR